jgi:anti-anti-sigma regulatory factor
MPLENLTIEGRRTCRISGALCIWEAAAVWGQLGPLLAEPLPLTIDLTAVEECDAAGIQILCQIRHIAETTATRPQFVGISPAVLQAMQQAGMDPATLVPPEEKE